MPDKNIDLTIGGHLPVYLWAGQGTVRMNKLKFMGAPVNEKVHNEAHFQIGISRISSESAFNWAYLMYNWGFPPEVEKYDWDEFSQAVQLYHQNKVKVFGYIQTSNCVFDGSYKGKDWYAQNPVGRRFYYYSGRYMTCLLNPDWREHLKQITKDIIESGADGVFYDNPWHACQPLSFAGTWIGPAGCYCPHCREAFHQATGLEIPASIQPSKDPTCRIYIRWRSEQMTNLLSMLAKFARSLNSNIVVSANDFDAIMRPSLLIYGIDLKGLSSVQDIIMIEDYGLPRWEAREDNGSLLVNNALTLRTAKALIGNTPLSTDPYDKGIGFDGVYSARRFQQGIAEAAACGAMMVVKGTEYVENGIFTLLTAEQYSHQRAAIGRINRWLIDNKGIFEDRRNIASIGLLYPGDDLWQDWHKVSKLYFAVGQALIVSGIPWRVVTGESDWDSIDTLITFTQVQENNLPENVSNIIHAPELPGWGYSAPSLISKNGFLYNLVSKLVSWLFQAYFEYRWVRKIGDNLGMVHLFTQSPHFKVPSQLDRKTLLRALGDPPNPHVISSDPVLLEFWKQGDDNQLNIVNYAGASQRVIVEFGRCVQGQIKSLNEEDKLFIGQSIEVDVDIFAMLIFRPRKK